MLEHTIADYNRAIYDTDRDRAFGIGREAEMRGASPKDTVFEIVIPAMDLMVKSVIERPVDILAQCLLNVQTADEVTSAMIPSFKYAPKITAPWSSGPPMEIRTPSAKALCQR